MTDCVKVALRVRPLIGLETAKGDNESVITYPAGTSEPQLRIGGDKSFTFDHIFNETSAQTPVYTHAVKPLVDAFLEGYNATVIAYGQTGSGKTYTMGTAGCDDAKLQEEWGVIPAAINDIFSSLQSAPDKDDYKVQCSFIEIYNEEIKDLLDAHSSKVLSIRESPDGPSKIYIPNMKLEVVNAPMECLEALDRGGASRATAYTQMNSQSSRSHAIFTIHLHHIKPPPAALPPGEHASSESVPGTATAPQPIVIQSKFHFVDLAGSERAKKSGATGARFQEGVSINAGLLALGNVIAALGDPRCRSKHVPFRDSKITRLLQDSLGGNSRTLMIACVSPARSNMLETKNTLNYANRAKNIENKAVVNRDPRSRQILQLRQRVKELERQLKIGGGGGELPSRNGREQGTTSGGGSGRSSQEQVEQSWQLQSDLSASNAEVLRLQEKIKHLRLSQSELQDKYYREVSAANSKVVLQHKKWSALVERVCEKYPEFESECAAAAAEGEHEEQQVLDMERLRLQNECLAKENQRLQRTIVANESRDQHLVHNLHHQMTKMVRGDFSAMRHDLISPTKQIDVSSSSDSLSVLSAPSENHHSDGHSHYLFEDDDDEDDDDEDDIDEDDDVDLFGGVATATATTSGAEGERVHAINRINDDEDDDEDNDVSMADNGGTGGSTAHKQEHAIEYKETTTEREVLRQEKKQSMVQKKKLMKEQKRHGLQMEFIANEQVSRERSQRLKSEKYVRDIDKTNRDITQLQSIMQQLCQQRQSDLSKQAFYEKQLESLSKELDDAHHQCQIHVQAKTDMNPDDTTKYRAQENKIANYQDKVKSLTLQIQSYRDKIGLIRNLQNMHREDVQKMSQMTFKVNDLKKKKVTLQRKLKEENKMYARWKSETDRTIKQLRKTQRDKSIQLQRHKTQLSKTEAALKQKTAALMHLKKRQRDLEMKKSTVANSRNAARTALGTGRSGTRGGGTRGAKMTQHSMKQIKSKIAELLTWFVTKHGLFHKYKSFDREYKSLQHQLKDYECALCDVQCVLNQLREQQLDEDDEEYNRLTTEKVETEQRIEDTQSTIAYIREQMVAMSHRMKDNDPKRWKQLQNAQKVSLNCTEWDLDQFLAIGNVSYARACINFLINQHLRFRLIVDDFKKTTEHLKSERDKILANADNELRKKSVLIEKLQNRIQEIQLQQQNNSNHDDDVDEDAEEEEHDDDDDEHGDDGDGGDEQKQQQRQAQGQDEFTLLHDDDDVFDDDDNDEDRDEQMACDSDAENGNIDISAAASAASRPQKFDDAIATAENEWRRKQNELSQSKKLLNMFRSPLPRSRSFSVQQQQQQQQQRPKPENATNVSMSLQPQMGERMMAAAPIVSATRSFSESFRTQIVEEPTRNTNGGASEHVTSIQLTPFHTPIVRSKTQQQQQSMQRQQQFVSLQDVNANAHAHIHSNNNNSDFEPLIAHQRESSHSPLCPVDFNGNLAELAPIHEQRHVAPRNVFSRLTNPKHYIGTARIKVQELQALKDKARKQKESHTQLQRKSHWQKRKTQQLQQSPLEMNAPNEWAMMPPPMGVDDSVFQRLHATSIRNSRMHNNGNGSLNNSFNQTGEMQLQNAPQQQQQQQQPGFMSDCLYSEPTRVFSQHEMTKKPQRNSATNSNANSFLSNPVRVNSPET